MEKMTMRTNKRVMTLALAGLMAGGATKAIATDIPVVPTKLIVVDKITAAGKSKAVFVAKDADVDKGLGTDPTTIGASLQIIYDNGTDPTLSGVFDAPSGAGWLVNKSTVAKYVNKDAPTGGSVKVSVIKPGTLVKVVGKSLGDTPLDILSASGATTGIAFTAYCFTNDTTSNCFCSAHNCVWKPIAGGSGAKLVCKGGEGDPSCLADEVSCSGGFPNGTFPQGDEECDDGDVDPTDGCTNSCTVCGNGAASAPEECDDGNLVSGDGCDANCRFTGCGNGLIVGSETCDDGNTADNDSCPSDCVVDFCAPDAGTDYTVTVDFAGSENVAGITVFLDYPEGKVSIPGSGGSVPSGIITDLPGFAFGQTNDLDHALIQAVVDGTAFPSGQLFKVHFEDCLAAGAPIASEFTCTVLTAGDAGLVPIAGVTCSVSLP
jgi:cysteine-rich repeat protein